MDDAITGWAQLPGSGDGAAHQIGRRTGSDGRVVHGPVCGKLAGSSGWVAAGAGATRCPECYQRVAGAPDVD